MARLRIEVVLALPGRQEIVLLELGSGATAADAVRASGLGAADARLGIGGKAADAGQVLRDGDRVELLRPLVLDPKEARRRRARKQR